MLFIHAETLSLLFSTSYETLMRHGLGTTENRRDFHPTGRQHRQGRVLFPSFFLVDTL